MKLHRTIGLVALLAMAGSHGVSAQAVARLSADTIDLGDQTTLTIQHARTYPSTDQLSQNGIVALSQEFDTAGHTQSTLLTCFEPGDHVLRLSEDDSLVLTVRDVDVDTASAIIRDVAPIEKVPYTPWEIIRWVLLALAVMAIAALAVWLWKKWKSGEAKQWFADEPADTRTPEQRALDRIEQLRTRRLWQNGKAKEYHTELTDAVRSFIEEATGIRATEMTSDETLDNLAARDLHVDLAPLRTIFSTADMVKFAKSEPQPHEHDRSMNDAVIFVKELWQQAAPAATSGKEGGDA